jgi:hypothetical protein
MTSTHDTDRMIHALAKQAGMLHPAPSYLTALIAGTVLSAISAVALALLMFGVREQGLMATVASAPFLFKIASMSALAAGGIVMAHHAGRPASSALGFMSLLPGLAILLFGGATDVSGFSILGASEISVPSCVASIVILSLPALALIHAAMRLGVPTRPAFAGAVAGMLAGAIGGAAYAVVCKNDGALFVSVWYPFAIAIVTAAGALLGRRTLAW